jgi:hypothetical protein
MSSAPSYFQERLESEIRWHSERARKNKNRFHLVQISILVASALIPIINVASFGDAPTRLASSVVGGAIVVATGISQLGKYQENWILYRTTSEMLKKEKYFFLNHAGEYSNLTDEERNTLLVERVESIISSETSKYFLIHSAKKPAGQSKGAAQANSGQS